MEQYQTAILLGLASVAVGFLFFLLVLKLLPYLERRENLAQREEVIKEAKRQQAAIIEDAKQQAIENEKLMFEDLDASIAQQKEDLITEEEALGAQESYYEQEQKRIVKIENTINEKAKHLNSVEGQAEEAKKEVQASKQLLIQALEKVADLNAKNTTDSIANQYRENRQLECQKVLKSLQEELNSSSRKRAQRVLDRVHARYAPNFVWPKAVNVVEVPNEKSMSYVNQDSCKLLDDLAELSGTTIKLIGGGNEDQKSQGILKVAGGYGIYKEAARLALAELINQPPNQWNRAQGLYNKHRARLEGEAVILGKKAVRQLQLDGIHPEVQKLIGALNWRTSYRQNQWHHTVEVAVFAGIIANELGVDPELGKRVGLLHDIGKAIDYRIEGSHAVISGDYADRYGETRLICDTVMSHHADLLVESALAYVLRAADTLSGARPGARVNLEEGYQIRLDAIAEAVKSFGGISDMAIMNGGREVHVQVNHKAVSENEVQALTESIARKIEEDVAYPGQIKVLVSRSFESISVA
ncbi:MAG: HDIG domain-containing metalloprotein [Oligoflexales bacterium]